MDDDLIARLEAATGPDREIDAEIAIRAGIRHRPRRSSTGYSKGREWFVDSHGGVEEWSRHPPAFTCSLDAALSLVPEGCIVSMLEQDAEDQLWRARVSNKAWLLEARDLKNVATVVIDDPTATVTPALALCIAALKAHKDTP